MKVVVLAGGISPERDVSLASGALISNALAKKGYDVLLLDLYKGIEDTKFNEMFSNEQKNYDIHIEKKAPMYVPATSLIGKNVLKICKMADIVYIALHGAIGENGKIQALFDCLGIKYTGTGYEGSLIAMNKVLTKKILEYEKIRTPKWQIWEEGKDLKSIKYPVIVKPSSNGSSIGVSIVNNANELIKAVKECEIYEDEIIIEEYIRGREFSVGLLSDKVLQPIEIIPKQGFYNYENKYQAGMTEEICPPKLDNNKIKELQDLTKRVHKALKLGTYSRIDFLLGEDEKFYCLEANTLPGMTRTSLMPQEAQVEGISYEDLCEKILLQSTL